VPDVMNMIPLSSLAAILFLVGYKLAKPTLFKQMAASGWEQFVPFIVTIIGIVFTDLLVGIGIGFAVALFLILRKNFITPFNFRKEEDKDHIEIILSENVTFLNKAGILQSLNAIPDNSRVIIDGRASEYIHPDVIEIINDFKISAANKNISLEVELSEQYGKAIGGKIKYFKKEVREADFKEDSYLKKVFNS